MKEHLPYEKFKAKVPKRGSRHVNKYKRLHAAIESLDVGEAVSFPFADFKTKTLQAVVAIHGRKVFGRGGYATRKDKTDTIITIYRIR